MKKVILALVVVAGLSASCKKSYTCTCYDSNGTASTQTVKATNTTNAALDCAAKGNCTL